MNGRVNGNNVARSRVMTVITFCHQWIGDAERKLHAGHAAGQYPFAGKARGR